MPYKKKGSNGYANDDPPLSACIEIAEVEWKDEKCSIKTTRDQYFSFWATKSNGQPSKANEGWEEMVNDVGDGDEGAMIGYRVLISYAEKPNPRGGPPYKNILWFESALQDQPVSEVPAAARAAKSGGFKKRTPEEVAASEAAHEATVIGKMVFGFIVAAIEAGQVTVKSANTGEFVAECVMLAERVQNQSQGPNRKKYAPAPEEEDDESSEREALPPKKARATKASGGAWDDEVPPF